MYNTNSDILWIVKDSCISRRKASKLGSFAGSSCKTGRIEFANLQIGFQLAYYRVRLFRLKAGGKGINVDTPRKAGGLLQRLVSHCLRCCSLPYNLRHLHYCLELSYSISLYTSTVLATFPRHSWTTLLSIRSETLSSARLVLGRCM